MNKINKDELRRHAQWLVQLIGKQSALSHIQIVQETIKERILLGDVLYWEQLKDETEKL